MSRKMLLLFKNRQVVDYHWWGIFYQVICHLTNFGELGGYDIFGKFQKFINNSYLFGVKFSTSSKVNRYLTSKSKSVLCKKGSDLLWLYLHGVKLGWKLSWKAKNSSFKKCHAQVTYLVNWTLFFNKQWKTLSYIVAGSLRPFRLFLEKLKK